MPPAKAELAIEFLPDVLAHDGVVWVSAISSSMAPLVRAGDELRLAPVGGQRLKAGAIVAYARGAQLVVHRVVRAGAGGIVARGDALSEADAPVAGSQVIGRVRAIRTPAGRTLDLARPPWPFLEPALGWLAGRRAHGWLAWKARRALFHLIAVFFR